MQRYVSLRFLLVLTAVVLAAAAAVAVQWQQTALLRADLECAKFAAEELAKLREENQRWRDKQIPAAELERLRADHAAIPRLRAELDALARPAGK